MSLIGVLGQGEPDMTHALMNAQTVRGIYVGSVELFERMNRIIELHKIEPVIDKVVPFSEVHAATSINTSAANNTSARKLSTWRREPICHGLDTHAWCDVVRKNSVASSNMLQPRPKVSPVKRSLERSVLTRCSRASAGLLVGLTTAQTRSFECFWGCLLRRRDSCPSHDCQEADLSGNGCSFSGSSD